MRRALAGAAVAAALLLCPSCAPVQRPGAVTVLGDSITINSFYGHGYGPYAPGDLNVVAGLGWHAGTPDIVTRARKAAADGDGATVVYALLTNDSLDGWNSTDVARTRRIIDMFPAATCWVVVLPVSRHPGLTATRAANLAAARAGAKDVFGPVGRKVYVDWQATVDRHGGTVLAADGIHLAPGPVSPMDPDPADRTAAYARSAETYWVGVDACQ